MIGAEFMVLGSRRALLEYVVGEGPCVCRCRCCHYGTIGEGR